MAKNKLGVIVGSNRRDSINRKLAQALAQLGGEAFEAKFMQIDDLPMYNQDNEQPVPAPVARFKSRDRGVRCPAVRDARAQPLDPGGAEERHRLGRAPLGQDLLAGQTGRRHRHLAAAPSPPRSPSSICARCSATLDCTSMGGEAYIQFKPELIDAQGHVTDESVRKFLKAFIDQFAAFARVPGQRVARGLDPARQSCPSDPSSASCSPSRPSKAPASSCAAPSASATPPRPIRSCCSTISATTARHDYLAGFPWHPHRGIETITYVLAGTVEHGDSLGNRGTLGAGDVQWMTAGRGIMHQEMPQGDAQGRMHGFQLWANLPSSLKMTAPRYQDVKAAEIPEIVDDDGTRVRVVCGEFWGKNGPVDGVAADPRYLDVFVPAGKRKTLQVEIERHAFAYVFEGSGSFRACLAALRRAHRETGRRRRRSCCASRSATVRWCCSIRATKSPCRPAMRASASCWCPASRSRSRSPGTARS